jgi:hypothetical protein
MTAYERALRDPRWQKRRLQVLDAAGWACEDCASTTKTLEVHHLVYIRAFKLKPWLYDDDLLMCLCEDCHEFRQGREEALHVLLAKTLRHRHISEIEHGVWDKIFDGLKTIAESENPSPIDRVQRIWARYQAGKQERTT